MNRRIVVGFVALWLMIGMGCATPPSRKVSELRLGMTPEEVLDRMGRPYAIRTAKLYRDGTFQEVWEYIPSIFSVALFADRYDKTFWVYFDNGRLVQWGEPGDFTGSPARAVPEYVPDRRGR